MNEETTSVVTGNDMNNSVILNKENEIASTHEIHDLHDDDTIPATNSDKENADNGADDTKQKPLALIVEDDADAAFIARRAMMENDYDVIVIHRGDEALEALKTLRPDVILLDLHLPVVGGVEILRFIRNEDELQDASVILVTADHATADMIENLADMVLLKPVMYTQIRDLVKRIMKHKI